MQGEYFSISIVTVTLMTTNNMIRSKSELVDHKQMNGKKIFKTFSGFHISWKTF